MAGFNRIAMDLPEPNLTWAAGVLSAIELISPESRRRIDCQVYAVESMDVLDEMEELAVWMSDNGRVNGPGKVLIRLKWQNGRRFTKNTFQAIFAHELGHACSSPDEEAACKAPSLAWAKETVADRYVYKWDLAGLIKRNRKNGLSPSYRPGRQISDSGNTYLLNDAFDWVLIARGST